MRCLEYAFVCKHLVWPGSEGSNDVWGYEYYKNETEQAAVIKDVRHQGPARASPGMLRFQLLEC